MDDELDDFIELAKQELVPKMADSRYVISIAPASEDYDLKAAIEIGLCILMGKPLIVLAPMGRTVADKLLRIADHVIIGDLESEAGRTAMYIQLERILNQ